MIDTIPPVGWQGIIRYDEDCPALDYKGLPTRIIEFIETLKLSAGAYVNKPFVLREWQRDIIRDVFGWFYVDSGLRVVRQGVLSLGRKNGKTELIAAIALACLCLDGISLENGEMVIAASDREQAGIMFHAMITMIRMDEEIAPMMHIIDSKKHVVYTPNGMRCKVVPAVAGSLMGLNPFLVLEDECGSWPAQKGLEVHTALNSAFGAQEEPLTLMLSTQAPNDEHFFSQIVDHVRMIQEGLDIDPTIKGFVFDVPEKDEKGDDIDPFDESYWFLANPALGDFRSLPDMKDYAKKAKRVPSLQNSFENLYLNRRVSAQSAWMARSTWKECGGAYPEGIDADLRERRCWGGLDLSSRVDLSNFTLVFEPTADDPHIYIKTWFWTPLDGIVEKSEVDHVPYDRWAESGFINPVPGNKIEYGFIANVIVDAMQEYELVGIGFDRYKIDQLIGELRNREVEVDPEVEDSLQMVPIGQGFRDQNGCVEILETVVLNRSLRHGDHPVLTWNISNAVTLTDDAENRKFTKRQSFGRIDGVIGLAQALRMMELDGVIGEDMSSGWNEDVPTVINAEKIDELDKPVPVKKVEPVKPVRDREEKEEQIDNANFDGYFGDDSDFIDEDQELPTGYKPVPGYRSPFET